MESSVESFHHVSVLLEECIQGLNIKPDGVYIDGTLGGAGHSFRIAEALSKKGRLIGIDQDGDAIAAAAARLKPFRDKVTIIRDNYQNIKDVMDKLGIQGADGILLDLGVSSYQLDTPERGFSYREDAPLDMRMDKRQEKTACDIVNGYTQQELCRVIQDFGEDRFAKNIAKSIVKARENKPIQTTLELAAVVEAAIPVKYRFGGGHPAKRTFQAVRIELNRELEVLQDSLDIMIDLLNEGGRLCVITFHSLEDRIVKVAFKRNENPCTCPPGFPVCVCGKKSKGVCLTKKPIVPGVQEMEKNSRAKSAKLRVFEKSRK